MENEIKKYGFPEETGYIWVLFILMMFGFKPSEENFEILLETLIESGISQDVIDNIKELKDKYEKDKDLLIEQLYKNEVNI